MANHKIEKVIKPLDQEIQSPEFIETPRRRRVFTEEYKEAILHELEACREQHGAVGALLRREGLYAAQVASWRKAYELQAAGTRKPGRPSEGKREAAELEQLRRQNARLQHELRQAHLIIEFQKKIAQMFEESKERPD